MPCLCPADHKEVECAILLNTDEALESFKAADSVLGLEYRGPGKENAGDDEDAPVLAYCLIDHGDRKEMLEVDLTGELAASLYCTALLVGSCTLLWERAMER